MPKFGKKKKSEDDGGAMTSDFDFPSEEEEESEGQRQEGAGSKNWDGRRVVKGAARRVDPQKRCHRHRRKRHLVCPAVAGRRSHVLSLIARAWCIDPL